MCQIDRQIVEQFYKIFVVNVTYNVTQQSKEHAVGMSITNPGVRRPTVQEP